MFKRLLNSKYSNLLMVVLGAIIVVLSICFSLYLSDELRDKEQHHVEMWAQAMQNSTHNIAASRDPILLEMTSKRQTIPFVITDANLNVVSSHLIPERIINHPDLLRDHIEKMADVRKPLVVQFMWSQQKYILFFTKSRLLRVLQLYPFIQMGVIITFICMGFLTFKVSKQDEQNRVWIGLAKETAHQLGTPTSSLLGWIEYLRSCDVEPSVVDEMSNDLRHLMKIVDRFSKIGSETILTMENVNEVVAGSVMYFRARLPKNVTLSYNGLAIAPIEANINVALFEWVIENLMKNSLDALAGQGEIKVNISTVEEQLLLDVSDTGKGIAKGNWRKIFEPGFTTKTRGWGLGLSLSRRIVEDYHHGKISVLESEIGQGTTIRIALNIS